MSTLIEQPDRASVEVAGLQPVARPTGQGGGLGAFLSGILPAVNQEIDKYQDESRPRLMALARNDQINNIQREVSVLDRRNYTYGVNFQKVVNGQEHLSQEFARAVRSIDPTEFDPEKFHEMAEKYRQSTIDNIFNSNLPPDVKEKMYQAQLTENVAQSKIINNRMKQIAEDANAITTQNLTAGLIRDLRSGEHDADSMVVRTIATYDKLVEGYMNTTEDATVEDAYDNAGKKVTAAFENVLAQIEVGGTAADWDTVQHLRGLAEGLAETDPDLSTKLYQKASETMSKIQTNNDTFAERQINELVTQMRLDPTMVTEENLMLWKGQVNSDISLSETKRTALLADLDRAYVQAVEAQLRGDEYNIEDVLTPTQANALGKSEGEWAGDVMTHLIGMYSDDPARAGYEAILMGNGQEYSPELIKRGSEVFFRTMVGYLSMSDADVKNDPYGEVRKANFARMQALYQQYKQQNPAKAAELLSGLDGEYASLFSVALENGGTLESIREERKNPVSMANRVSMFPSLVTGLDAKTLGVSSSLSPISGYLTRNQSDALDDNYAATAQRVFLDSQSTFAPQLTAGASSETLVNLARSQGMFIESPDGYNAAIVPARVAKQMRGAKVSGTNAPLTMPYWGKGLDIQRKAFAKKFKVRPDNIIISANRTGDEFIFEVYDIQGNLYGLRDGKPVLMNPNDSGFFGGTTVPTAVIKRIAEKMYEKDNSRKVGKTGVPSNPPITASATDRSAATRAFGALGRTQEKYTVPKGKVDMSRFSNPKTPHVPVGSVVVKDLSFRGRSTPLKIKGNYALAMGGNKTLAQEFVTHLQDVEGFVSKPQTAKDANSGKVATIYAMGVTSASMTAQERRKFNAAAGNPQKLMDLQGEFMKNYYSKLNIQKDFSNVGIPAPSTQAYPTKYKGSALLLYDVGWHGHNGALYGSKGKRNGVVHAMNAPTYREGLSILKRTSVYNRKDPNHKRNKWMERQLYSHFRAMGKL